MPELSRSQVVVYCAVAIALLLVGARAIRAEGGSGAEAALGEMSTSSGGGGIRLRSGGGDIVVDVAGAVRRPGVYRLPAGARVVDAVTRAGGATGGALLEGLNRAARLTDGQQVVVPGRETGSTSAGPPSSEGAPIGLGGATVEQLETIDGIGPVTAQKIVEYRDRQGGLASVEQLDEVSGIGPATMDSLRDRLQP